LYNLSFLGSKSQEGEEIEEFQDQASPINGEDQNAVRLNEWHSIQQPDATVEEGAHIWYG
jgi:hypothetical protein